MPVWSEVREIDWRQLPGAYRTERDVPGALETLRWGTDADADDYQDAWSDVLYGHVWHQGSIFAVTAAVLPFVFDIVDHSPALAGPPNQARTELATFITCCAAAARDASTSLDAEEAEHGRAVLAVLALRADRLRAWTRSELSAPALAAMLNIPQLSGGVLAGEEAELRAVLAAVFEQARWLDRSVLAWAGQELARVSSHPVAAQASRLLSGSAARPLDGDDARLAALGQALAAAGDLDQRLEPLRDLFGIAIASQVAGESPAVVVVTDEDWFVVQGARKLTIRWPSHPFEEGDEVVLLDIGAGNCARALRGTGKKSEHRASFDSRGNVVPAP